MVDDRNAPDGAKGGERSDAAPDPRKASSGEAKSRRDDSDDTADLESGPDDDTDPLSAEPPVLPPGRPARPPNPSDDSAAPPAASERKSGDTQPLPTPPPVLPPGRAPDAKSSAEGASRASGDARAPDAPVREKSGNTQPLPPTPPVLPSGEAPSPAKDPRENSGETILRPLPRPAAHLHRIGPPGRSEMIRLDGDAFVLGRGRSCSIPLYSPSASRKHARLYRRADRWVLEPLPQKRVLVNGEAAAGEVLLEPKSVVRLGDDELVFLPTLGEQSGIDAVAAVERGRRFSPWRIAMLVVAIVLAALSLAPVILGGLALD